MLSRVERATFVAVVLVGVLVLTAMVVAALRWQHVKAWLDAPEAIAAFRAVRAADLPPELEPDATLSACDLSAPVRCAWTDLAPEEAVEALAAAVEGAGLTVGEIRCDEASLPLLAGGGTPVCAAAVTLSGARMWLLATDVTPVGQVPLGRTAAWLSWDEPAMSVPMARRLQREWVWDGRTEPLTRTELDALLPERLRPILDATCRGWDANGCRTWEGPIDVSDLGDDGVPALVAELTEAGFFVDLADPDWSSARVKGHRYAAPASRLGITVHIRIADGIVVGTAFTY